MIPNYCDCITVNTRMNQENVSSVTDSILLKHPPPHYTSVSSAREYLKNIIRIIHPQKEKTHSVRDMPRF